MLPIVHGVPLRIGVGPGVIFNSVDVKRLNLVTVPFIQAVTNALKLLLVSGVRTRNLATMELLHAQLGNLSTRQPVAPVPRIKTASLARMDTIANGAKIALCVKRKAKLQTVLARLHSRTLAMRIAGSTETLVAPFAEIYKDVDGATIPVWTPASVHADLLHTRANQSVPFTNTATLATTTPPVCGAIPRAPVSSPLQLPHSASLPLIPVPAFALPKRLVALAMLPLDVDGAGIHRGMEENAWMWIKQLVAPFGCTAANPLPLSHHKNVLLMEELLWVECSW